MSENSNQRVSQALSHTGDCPALDRLIDLLSQKNAATVAHLDSCAHCTTEIALFREFQEPVIRPEEKADLVAFLKSLSGKGWQSIAAPASFPQ